MRVTLPDMFSRAHKFEVSVFDVWAFNSNYLKQCYLITLNIIISKVYERKINNNFGTEQ